MALTVKNLGSGQLTTTSTTTLYVVPMGKAAIVKNQRFVNRDTVAHTINIFYARAGTTQFQLLPKNLSLAPNALVIDQDELTLAAGDQIQGGVDSGTTLDFVISGIERDA